MDKIHQLISKGRKQGYLLFEEIGKTFNENVNDWSLLQSSLPPARTGYIMRSHCHREKEE